LNNSLKGSNSNSKGITRLIRQWLKGIAYMIRSKDGAWIHHGRLLGRAERFMSHTQPHTQHTEIAVNRPDRMTAEQEQAWNEGRNRFDRGEPRTPERQTPATHWMQLGWDYAKDNQTLPSSLGTPSVSDVTKPRGRLNEGPPDMADTAALATKDLEAALAASLPAAEESFTKALNGMWEEAAVQSQAPFGGLPAQDFSNGITALTNYQTSNGRIFPTLEEARQEQAYIMLNQFLEQTTPTEWNSADLADFLKDHKEHLMVLLGYL
jgi:hypothetical protein